MCSADSPGRSTSNASVLIFDLDGTILSVNSFPHWVRAMLLGSSALQAARILAQRKLLGQSHAAAKERFQALWIKQNDPQAQEALTQSLLKYVRPELKDVLERITADNAVLATSAAACYAKDLGTKLGFTHMLATELNAPENCKEEKRNRVLAWLAHQGWNDRKRIFFTDHEEDLPLMKECALTLWFGETEAIPNAPELTIVPGRDKSAEQILKLVG